MSEQIGAVPPQALSDEATKDLVRQGWLPVIGPPGPFGPDLKGRPIEIDGLPPIWAGGSFVGWTCPSCSSIVRNPGQHERWHDRFGTWDLTWMDGS